MNDLCCFRTIILILPCCTINIDDSTVGKSNEKLFERNENVVVSSCKLKKKKTSAANRDGREREKIMNLFGRKKSERPRTTNEQSVLNYTVSAFYPRPGGRLYSRRGRKTPTLPIRPRTRRQTRVLADPIYSPPESLSNILLEQEINFMGTTIDDALFLEFYHLIYIYKVKFNFVITNEFILFVSTESVVQFFFFYTNFIYINYDANKVRC